MLSDTITLAVDAANDGNPANVDYTRFSEFQNRSVYIGDGHTVLSKNELNFYRSFPTKTGNFNGTAKTSAKFTRSIEVNAVDGVSVLNVPMILEINFSFPVGTTAAQMTEFRQRAIALLDSDAIMNKVNNQLMV